MTINTAACFQQAMVNVYDEERRLNQWPPERDWLGLVYAVTSAANTEAVNCNILPPGQYAHSPKKVEVAIYFSPGTEDAPRPSDFYSEICRVDRKEQFKVYLTKRQMEQTYMSEDMEATAGIAFNAIDNLLRRANQDLLLHFAINTGNFADGSRCKTVDLVDEHTRKANDQAGRIFHKELKLAGGVGEPFVVGGFTLEQYASAQGAHDKDGRYTLDPSEKHQFRGFWDTQIDDVIRPPDNYFMFAPRAIQMLNWVNNIGDRDTQTLHGESQTIMDPITGLLFDFDKRWIDEERRYCLIFTLHYDFLIVPALVYAPEAKEETGPLLFHFQTTYRSI